MISFFNKEHNWHLTNPHIIQMSCPFDISPACEKVTAFKESAHICRSAPTWRFELAEPWCSWAWRKALTTRIWRGIWLENIKLAFWKGDSVWGGWCSKYKIFQVRQDLQQNLLWHHLCISKHSHSDEDVTGWTRVWQIMLKYTGGLRMEI